MKMDQLNIQRVIPLQRLKTLKKAWIESCKTAHCLSV